MLGAVFLLLFWPWTVIGQEKKEAQSLTVFAAASLTVPLQKITTAYTETGAGRVDLSFAASST
ncbi:MAG: hypothetical protein QF833_05455, partial [Alphaproteobacteria bacterium]|nr:hypothetical protein [Alphaproteobacteria bacterium]